MPIYVASLASARLTDDNFAEALASAAPRCILLLEDVDAAFIQRERSGAGGSLTFSGLLNAIDGVAAQEGRLLFLTTNHPELLDPALVRPGRVDVRVPFKLCTRPQILAYCRHFYGPAISEQTAEALANAVPIDSVSVAQLQGVLMQHPEDPLAAVTGCQSVFASLPPSSADSR